MKWHGAVVLAAGLVITGCSTATDSSDVLARAANTSTTTTTAALSEAELAVVDDLVTVMLDDEYGGFSERGVTCIAAGIAKRFGVETAGKLVDDFENDGVALSMADARAAGSIVLGCVDYRTGSRMSFIQSGFSAVSADCFFEQITDAELELGAVMDFLDQADYDAPMGALADKARQLLTECIPEDEMTDMFTQALLDSGLGAQNSLEEVSCLARSVLREVGLEGLGEIGDDGATSLRMAEALADAFIGCTDVRASLADAMAADGAVSPDVATCLVGHIADADLRELLIRSLMQVGDGELGELLADQLAQCGGGPAGQRSPVVPSSTPPVASEPTIGSRARTAPTAASSGA